MPKRITMPAMAVLMDLISDPKDNGEYELHLKGADLNRLWDAVENTDKMLRAIDASTDLETARRRALKALTSTYETVE